MRVLGTGGRVGLRGFGDDGLYVFFGLVVERPEGPVDCAVCRNLVFGEPFSVDVDEQDRPAPVSPSRWVRSMPER